MKNMFDYIIIQSRVTGYEYAVLGIDISKRGKIKSYYINNNGRLEWWDFERFHIKKISSMIKKTSFYEELVCEVSKGIINGYYDNKKQMLGELYEDVLKELNNSNIAITLKNGKTIIFQKENVANVCII